MGEPTVPITGFLDFPVRDVPYCYLTTIIAVVSTATYHVMHVSCETLHALLVPQMLATINIITVHSYRLQRKITLDLGKPSATHPCTSTPHTVQPLVPTWHLKQSCSVKDQAFPSAKAKGPRCWWSHNSKACGSVTMF